MRKRLVYPITMLLGWQDLVNESVGVSKDMQLKCGTKECTMPTRGINGNDDTDWKTTQGWVYCLVTLLIGERRSA